MTTRSAQQSFSVFRLIDIPSINHGRRLPKRLGSIHARKSTKLNYDAVTPEIECACSPPWLTGVYVSIHVKEPCLSVTQSCPHERQRPQTHGHPKMVIGTLKFKQKNNPSLPPSKRVVGHLSLHAKRQGDDSAWGGGNCTNFSNNSKVVKNCEIFGGVGCLTSNKPFIFCADLNLRSGSRNFKALITIVG